MWGQRWDKYYGVCSIVKERLVKSNQKYLQKKVRKGNFISKAENKVKFHQSIFKFNYKKYVTTELVKAIFKKSLKLFKMKTLIKRDSFFLKERFD